MAYGAHQQGSKQSSSPFSKVNYSLVLEASLEGKYLLFIRDNVLVEKVVLHYLFNDFLQYLPQKIKSIIAYQPNLLR